MRRGTNGAGVHRLEDGRMYGVNLGADFTAEHEWGIKALQRDFALNASAWPGVPRRTIHTVPGGHSSDAEREQGVVLQTIKHDHRKDRYDPITGESYVVAYMPYGALSMSELHFRPPYKGERDEDIAEIVGAWSESDFAVHFRPEHRQDAQDLYDAFGRRDVAFLFGNVGNNPFANAGLCLTIVSRIPSAIVENLAEQDADNDALKVAADATGIKAEIDALSKAWRKAHPNGDYYGEPCGYYALSPRWDDREKGTIRFWLNPTDQKNNNAGWYTVEQLRQWMQGEGPVPMKKKAKA